MTDHRPRPGFGGDDRAGTPGGTAFAGIRFIDSGPDWSGVAIVVVGPIAQIEAPLPLRRDIFPAPAQPAGTGAAMCRGDLADRTW